MQCIPSGQYILADRLFRKSGYLVECEVFLTFGCQFPSKKSFEKSKNTKFYLVEREVLSTFGCQFLSKRSFEKSKSTEVCLNLILKWQH